MHVLIFPLLAIYFFRKGLLSPRAKRAATAVEPSGSLKFGRAAEFVKCQSATNATVGRSESLWHTGKCTGTALYLFVCLFVLFMFDCLWGSVSSTPRVLRSAGCVRAWTSFPFVSHVQFILYSHLFALQETHEKLYEMRSSLSRQDACRQTRFDRVVQSSSLPFKVFFAKRVPKG